MTQTVKLKLSVPSLLVTETATGLKLKLRLKLKMQLNMESVEFHDTASISVHKERVGSRDKGKKR